MGRDFDGGGVDRRGIGLMRDCGSGRVWREKRAAFSATGEMAMAMDLVVDS